MASLMAIELSKQHRRFLNESIVVIIVSFTAIINHTQPSAQKRLAWQNIHFVGHQSFRILPTVCKIYLIKRSYNTRLASTCRSSYTLLPIRTNYGKFSIKFQGAKIWNSLSEETKSLHRLAFKKTLKREIIQSYWYTIIFYSSCSQFLIHKYINSFTIACHYSCIVNIIVFL